MQLNIGYQRSLSLHYLQEVHCLKMQANLLVKWKSHKLNHRYTKYDRGMCGINGTCKYHTIMNAIVL